MSRANPNKNKLPPFTPLLNSTLDSAAWRAMSHGARSLYGCLKRRVPRGRNTAYLSYRDAADEMGCCKTTVERGYQELQHYGFIVLVRHGCLGVDGKGKAALWRLTELGNTSKTSAAGLPEAPTRDFLTWDGTRYRRDRSGVDYANLTKRKNRIPSPHQGHGVPPSRTVVSPQQGHPKGVPPTRTPKGRSVPP
jgi:hypothetical protein